MTLIDDFTIILRSCVAAAQALRRELERCLVEVEASRTKRVHSRKIGKQAQLEHSKDAC